MPSELYEKPILIVGVMRSGTTLLNRILNAHPQLYFFYNQTDFLRRYNNKYDPLNENTFFKFLNDYKLHMNQLQIEISDHEIEIIRNFIKEHYISYKNLYLALAISHLQPSDNGRWGEKYAGFGVEQQRFIDLFPKGQVIAITRNLVDVYISNKEKVKRENPQAYERGDHLLILDDWRQFTKNWREFTRKAENNSYLHITYEDLLSNPITITKKICAFLNLEWSNDMIDEKKLVYEDGKIWNANTSFDYKIMGLDKNNIGRHRKEILNDELELIQFLEKNYAMKKSDDQLHAMPINNPLVQKLESVVSMWKSARNY